MLKLRASVQKMLCVYVQDLGLAQTLRNGSFFLYTNIWQDGMWDILLGVDCPIPCRASASQAPPLNASSSLAGHYENESTFANPKTAPWVLYQLPEGLFQILNYVSCLSTPSYPQTKSKFLSPMPKVLLIWLPASSLTGQMHTVSPPSPLPAAQPGRADD